MHYMDKANLAALFYSDKEMKQRALKLVSLGTLNVTSGHIVACDPLVYPDTSPFERRVSPGRYTVEYVKGDSRPALLVMWLREREAIDPAELTWQMALVAGEDVSSLGEAECFGYCVDSGLGGLMDADAARAIVEREERAMAEDPDFISYYDNFLINETEDAFEHIPSGEPDGCNIMMCTSGWGDGLYPSYWALDKQGEPVALVTDFMIIKNGDARSEDDIANETYLDGLSPEKLAALEALEAAIRTGDVDAAEKLCADGLVGTNEIIPSSGGTAIFEAIRLDMPTMLTMLLGDRPCPEMPARLKSTALPDYFAYAYRMREFHQKKRQPRTPEAIDILLRSVGQTKKTPSFPESE